MLPQPHERSILHVDANCFFVSCHVALDPQALGGRPVAVAGDRSRRAGVILSASYEARRMGVATAMPLGEALRLCPELVVLPPDFGLYRDRSQRMHALFSEFSPVVEPFSIDEAWLDLTGCNRLLTPVGTAQTIQRRLEAELGLPASVGLGPNKLLAKMASGLKKPRGITELRRSDVPVQLWPLPVDELLGVGPALAGRLRHWNVRTIGDLAALGPGFCERRLGHVGRRLWSAAYGRDDSPVNPAAGADPKSISCALTLGVDVRTPQEARPILLDLAERLARRLRQGRLVAQTVSVTLRDDKFRERSRSRGLSNPSDGGIELFKVAQELALPALDGSAGYRLLRVTASHLQPGALAIRQRSLFDAGTFAADPAQRRGALAVAADAMRDRFGDRALMPALLVACPAARGRPQAG